MKKNGRRHFILRNMAYFTSGRQYIIGVRSIISHADTAMTICHALKTAHEAGATIVNAVVASHSLLAYAARPHRHFTPVVRPAPGAAGFASAASSSSLRGGAGKLELSVLPVIVPLRRSERRLMLMAST